ncbi:hypothetical protein GYA19_02955 [Candidatus Beckwithbacteria bacterium]|nr:hypothetical protein [Candidatus Beckwithbacteria bacterium]
MKINFSNKPVLWGIFFYLSFFYLVESTNVIKTNWLNLSAFSALPTFILVYFLTKKRFFEKILLAFLTIILAFSLSFIYSNLAYFEASAICSKALKKEYPELVENNPIEANGFNRFWNLTEKCANNLLPFPWFRKAEF